MRSMIHAVLLAACALPAAAGAAKGSFGPIKAEHPRLYATAAGFERLRDQLPILDGLPESGTLSFELTPGRKLDGETERMVFGDAVDRAPFFLRHSLDADTATTARFQFVVSLGARNKIWEFDVPFGQKIAIRFQWDKNERTATFRYGNTEQVVRELPADWKATTVKRLFSGRSNDLFSAVLVQDGSGKTLLRRESLEPVLVHGWVRFTEFVRIRHRQLAQCAAGGNDEVCDAARSGPRTEMPRTIQAFALMYRLTGDRAYLLDTKAYADRIMAVPPETGGEWSASSRLAALALAYDWLNAALGSEYGNAYLERIVTAIKANIMAAPQPRSGAYLYPFLKGICGKAAPVGRNGEFSCSNDLVFENWDGQRGASISREYIGGHPTLNVATISMALLAIGHEHPEVRPMLEIAAKHYDLGFWRALRYIAVDGGHHQGWGYAATSTPAERLLVWQTALENGSPFRKEDWATRMIHPFIYGYRGRSRWRTGDEFPARGDAFGIKSTNGAVGQLARAAAVLKHDAAAAYFYRHIILAKRMLPSDPANGMDTLLENLYWPGPVSVPATGLALPLSRYFRNAGQVLARDSWDFENAALFEFKSSSFASINHQHLDQNSFTLYFKGPLALDTGVYDDYGSPHWANYYTRSIAHNTITVFDPAEQFGDSKEPLSNDGGQWFVNGQVFNPTIEQIQPGNGSKAPGPNYLRGIEAYEANDAFTYVQGNASASYAAGKLDAERGFVRRTVYLQPNRAWKRPVVIVYDQVRTNARARLLPTFLLHTEGEPAAPDSRQAAEPRQGRYPLAFGHQKRVFLARNANRGAMAMEVILPERATFTKVGGLGNGQVCKQVLAGGAPAREMEDCRFTAPVKVGQGYEWVNFPPRLQDKSGAVRKDLRVADMGSWRIEIKPAEYAPTNQFLNLFTIRDLAAGDPLEPIAASRVGRQGTEALLVGGDSADAIVVAFNGGEQPARELAWQGSGSRRFLAVGLVPDQPFTVKMDDENGTVSIVITPAGGPGTYRSSADGVIFSEGKGKPRAAGK